VKKLKRAQPRSKTPPVSLRGETSGERVVLMLDESHVTTERSASISRQPIFLRLGAGLSLTLSSRKMNKRRYPLLTICIAGQAEKEPQLGEQFQQTRNAFRESPSRTGTES
jgi:hypothetical protein